ncbi:MAG: flagellar protein [Candidatus Kapabacteria bacterium]|jgi:flagellar operon protein|nr:flagellar protein [Candidatus Kapabacteria bacterium]
MPEINGLSVPFLPAGGASGLQHRSAFINQNRQSTKFGDLFNQELNKLKFSGHAQSRIDSRDVSISPQDMVRLESAVLRAKEKGSNESLVLMDEKAFIVNIPNKTVVTVFNRQNMESNVVTKIDSAVFA